jgi:1,4-alpha-glucan branching enzyme
MSSLGNDRWQIKITPQSYFKVPSSVRIYRIGMVFRNADGSREGKNASNGDIFIQIASSGLTFRILQPEQRPFFVLPGEQFPIEVEASAPAHIRLFLNNQLQNEVSNSRQMTHTLSATGNGGWITVTASDAERTVADSFRYEVLPPQTVEALPTGIEDGISYLSETSAIFSLFAPEKKQAYLIGDFNNWTLNAQSFMKKTPDGKRFWMRIDNLSPGQEYRYQYVVDGNIRIADPYAEKVLDPFHDRFIPESSYLGLIPYPTGITTGIVGVIQTAKPKYEWKTSNFVRPQAKDLVIYELLVRDFSAARTYKAVEDSLDYLKRMGINAIELLPIMEFEGNESWGYNPMYFFAPDKYYGTANALKSLIDKAHEKGIAVILDMVLNHAFGQCALVQLYWDAQLNRPAANSPYFNQTDKHDFSVGYDFNHESEAVKYFVKRVNSYWLKEFRFDGYRFDLSKGFTQRNTLGDVNAWSRYDASRVAIWKRIYDEIRAEDPSAYVILEHFADNAEETELANYGMMLWSNTNHQYSNAAQGRASTDNLIRDASYLRRGWNVPHLISYMESHDEERLMVRNLQSGGAQGSYNTRQLSTALERMKQAAAFYFTIPGPKMIWQFGELGYDVPINENGRTGNKPVRWEYLNNPDRARLYKVYAALMRLRQMPQAAATFQSAEHQISERNGGLEKIITLRHPDMDAIVAGNFGLSVLVVETDFPRSGTWYDYFSGKTLEVAQNRTLLRLQPGQFHIFTSKALPSPEAGLLAYSLQDDITSAMNEAFAQSIRVYPNPSVGSFAISINDTDASALELSVSDLTGRILYLFNDDTPQQERHISIDLSGQASGLYLIKLRSGTRTAVKKLRLE